MRSGSVLFKLALSAMALSLTACGKMEFNQSPLEIITRPFFPVAKGIEVVSGSTTNERTVLNGYYIDASVGSVRDQIDSETPNGYRVFHGVKGAIVSDETSAAH